MPGNAHGELTAAVELLTEAVENLRRELRPCRAPEMVIDVRMAEICFPTRPVRALGGEWEQTRDGWQRDYAPLLRGHLVPLRYSLWRWLLSIGSPTTMTVRVTASDDVFGFEAARKACDDFAPREISHA